MRFPRRVVVLGGAVCALCATPALATDSRPRPSWVTDGAGAVERIGNRVYLGGVRRVGPRSGPFAVLSADTAVADARMPEVTGIGSAIHAVESDGAGGWYIAGRFSHVDGLPRNGLAHVLADGSVDPAFAPVLDGGFEGSPLVTEMAVGEGALYIVGIFEGVNGTPRGGLAAIDATTGATLTWDPGLEAGVYDLAVGSGQVYLAGDFDAVRGVPRANLAAVDAATGEPTAFRADVTGPVGTPISAVEVNSIDLAGGTLYVVGQFAQIGGVEREAAGAVDAQTGEVRAWNPALSWSSVHGEPLTPTLQAVAAAPDRVFIAGWFDRVNGEPRPGLAATDPAGGTTLGWQPPFKNEGRVAGLVYGQGRVYTTGVTVGLDADSGAVEWAPEVDRGVPSVALDGNRVALGGDFRSVAMRRAGLVGLDAATGEPVPGTPEVRDGAEVGRVGALQAVGDTLYLQGEFDSIDGQPRAGFAAIDGTTGAVLPWMPQGLPGAPDTARLVAATRGAVYIESFENGVSVVFAFEPATGDPLPFRVRLPDAALFEVEPAGGLVYLAYTMLPGPNRGVFEDGPAYVAARTADGGRLCWRAPITGKSGTYRRSMGAYDLEADGRRLYLGGHFTSVGGQARTGLAALDARTGVLEPWNPPYSGIATSLAVAGESLFVAGVESPLAELRSSDGAPTEFGPGIWGGTKLFYTSPPEVEDLEVGADGVLHVVGSFRGTREAAVSGYAAFAGAPEPGPEPAGVNCRDRWSPKIELSNRRRSLRRALASGWLTGVKLDERARVELSVYLPRAAARRYGLGSGARRIRVAHRRLGLRAGSHRVRMPLSARARRRLPGRGRVTLILEAFARDRAGNERGPVRRRVVLVSRHRG